MMEKKRAADKGDRKFVAYPGPCNAHSCVGENACKPYDNGANHTCVCTHDSQPPYPDGTCPRKVVASVDESSGRIPVQPIASHENHMSLNDTPKPHLATLMEDKSTTVASNPDLNQHLVYVSVVSVIAFLLLISTIFFIYMNRRRRKRRENSSPLGLKQNFLIPERYAPNPQYTSCPATTIPILKKETLSFHKEVGEGCFGKVFKGELHCDDDQTRVVAIKVLKDTANKEAEEDFLREVEIMSAFKHSNILSLLGVVLKDDNVNPMMVFEFMPLGDLAELLRSQTQSKSDADLPELGRSELLSTALQIARGMEYLASQRFVHRDLACRNCLVGDELVVKIADFGMSRDVYTCDYYKIGGSRLLPIRWMSPESIHYGRFTLESDVWSYGVVLWEIFSYGKQPYYGHSNEEVLHFILADVSLEQPCGCPASIYALMKRCWMVEPRSRITFALICEWLDEEISRGSPRGKCRKDTRSLPRPPPLVLPGGDLLDSEGYLKPVDKDLVTYLDPMV